MDSLGANNLQMIQEQEGENQLYQTHTQDIDMPGVGEIGSKEMDVQRIENNINLIH